MTAMALAIMSVAIVTRHERGLARARPLVLASLLECPRLAQSGRPNSVNRCPLLGVKRTLVEHSEMSAYDRRRELAAVGNNDPHARLCVIVPE